jgi:hypothetical protein
MRRSQKYLIRLLLVCYDLTDLLHKKFLSWMLRLRLQEPTSKPQIESQKGANMRLRTKH